MRLTPIVVQRLLDRFGDHPQFEIVTGMGESASLFRSDLLITDWSAMAIEYFLGLEKPVLFIDVPRRIRNPDWETWEIEPFEAAIRQQAGTVLHPSAIKEAAHCIRSLMTRRPEFQARARNLRAAAVFNPGSSAALGAAELVRLARQPASHAPAGQAHA
jgi:YidC/Oxa1 family membrane protein insertase